MLKEKTGKAIKKRMIDLDVKGADFARQLNVSRQLVSAVLNCTIENKKVEEFVLNWYENSRKKKGE